MSTSPGAPVRIEPAWETLATHAELRPATAADAVDGVQPSHVAVPNSLEQLSAVLSWANQNHVAVAPRGGATKMGWGNLPGALDLIISMEKIRGVVDHPWQDMTVTVNAGTTLAELHATVAQHGQGLPLDVLAPEHATIGGVIATNDSGSLRLRFGSARDLILGVTVVLANGTIARSGGRVVKNVAGYDLPKLFTGSYGTLGIIAEITLRTYPLPHEQRTLTFAFPSFSAANRFLLAIADSTLVPTGAQIRSTSGDGAGVDLRFEGLQEGIAAQAKRATDIAAVAPVSHSNGDPWDARNQLFRNPIVGKFSVPPTQIARCASSIRSLHKEACVVAQSLGLGCFGLPEADSRKFIAAREAIAKLGGSLVFLQLPPDQKQHLDVFGNRASAYPLMVRLKQQFDPNGILNPGRFIGGI